MDGPEAEGPRRKGEHVPERKGLGATALCQPGSQPDPAGPATGAVLCHPVLCQPGSQPDPAAQRFVELRLWLFRLLVRRCSETVWCCFAMGLWSTGRWIRYRFEDKC